MAHRLHSINVCKRSSNDTIRTSNSFGSWFQLIGSIEQKKYNLLVYFFFVRQHHLYTSNAQLYCDSVLFSFIIKLTVIKMMNFPLWISTFYKIYTPMWAWFFLFCCLNDRTLKMKWSLCKSVLYSNRHVHHAVTYCQKSQNHLVWNGLNAICLRLESERAKKTYIHTHPRQIQINGVSINFECTVEE